MRYIDRRFLLPVAAATAWAQQPSPEAAAAEAALRARAEQFFQLQVDKKYRQAEAMVAEDTKDTYYNGAKFSINSFKIDKIQLLDANTRAIVTLKAKVTLALPQAGSADFETPAITHWKVENGLWVWYSEPTVEVDTPFGKMKVNKDGPAPPLPTAGNLPSAAALQGLVKINRSSVALTPAAPKQTVTISNDMPGAIDIELNSASHLGFTAEFEKKHLESKEKTAIVFTAKGGVAEDSTVLVTVSPLGSVFEIHVVATK